MLEIPLTSDAPHFSQEHQILGRSYVIEFEWVERECYWVLHLYDAAEKPLALGLRISLGWPIFVDRATKLVLLLMAQKTHASLNLKTFHKDFVLVAYEAAV